MSNSNNKLDAKQLAYSYYSLYSFLKETLHGSPKNAIDLIQNRLYSEENKDIFKQISPLFEGSQNTEDKAE